MIMISASSDRSLAAPQSEAPQMATDSESEPQRPVERQARAMYFTKSPQVVATRPPGLPIANVTERNIDQDPTSPVKNESIENTTLVVPIQWTPVNSSMAANASLVTNATLAPNVSSPEQSGLAQNGTFTPKRRNLTRPDLIKDASIDSVSESRIVTEKPLSLETTLLQTKMPPLIESSRQVIEPTGRMDTGTIAGISFAALALTALAGSTGFVLYRRRYLNKPQTLNDKCSNPDSSGYLDDSTIRVSGYFTLRVKVP